MVVSSAIWVANLPSGVGEWRSRLGEGRVQQAARGGGAIRAAVEWLPRRG